MKYEILWGKSGTEGFAVAKGTDRIDFRITRICEVDSHGHDVGVYEIRYDSTGAHAATLIGIAAVNELMERRPSDE